jgi:hypothetical protein
LQSHRRWHHVEPWAKNKMEKSENSRFYGQNKFFLAPCSLALGNFSHMVTCRSSIENTWKMNVQSVLNKHSPWAPIELEFDVLGLARRIVKYVSYCTAIIILERLPFGRCHILQKNSKILFSIFQKIIFWKKCFSKI